MRHHWPSSSSRSKCGTSLEGNRLAQSSRFGNGKRYNYSTVLKYSIVVPFHNEEQNVTELYDRLKAVMEATQEPFELVFVDDGSNDHTFSLLQQIAAVDRRVVVVKLRRNFGQTSALAAGFDHCQAEYVLAMDGDLQHDPDDIPLFLEQLRAGYDIVSGWRKERIDNFVMRRIPSRIANWLMAKLSGVDIHDFGTTFKAYRREVVQEVPLYGELHRFIPALASAYGATHLRNTHSERQSRAWRIALRHRAHLPRVFRPDHHPFPAQVHVTSLAFLWRLWRDQFDHRTIDCILDGH